MIQSRPRVQLPAILHGILEMFGRKGVSDSDIDSKDLARYINKVIAEYGCPCEDSLTDEQSLGRGLGLERDVWEMNDPNRDPFITLQPKKIF